VAARGTLLSALYSTFARPLLAFGVFTGLQQEKIPVAYDVTGLLRRVKLNKCQSRSGLMMLGGA
jgi:hypothetical protein